MPILRAEASPVRRRSARQTSPMTYAPYCARYPRHLATLIRRALTCRPMDTVELCAWAYPGQRVVRWMLDNIRRACRQWGIKQIGKRGKTLLVGLG